MTKPISIAPLITLRVVWGVVLFISTVRFIALGWIDDHYLTAKVLFPYYGFEWVRPLPAAGMYALHGLMLLSAAGIALGAWYRWSAWLFFLAFTYCQLLDVTYYLNHYYFVSVLTLWLACLPAHRAWSVDVWRRPTLALIQVPFWQLGVIRMQTGLLYVTAGLAKITTDWLLKALPLRIWLPAASDIPIVGPVFAHPWAPWVFSWGGMFYDLFIPFLLMWPPTALWAYGLVIIFHTVVGILFQIGVFPVVMIGVATVFFPSKWHQRAWAWIKALIGNKTKAYSPAIAPPVAPGQWSLPMTVAGGFLFFQCLFPLRMWAYPGNPFWHEQGYRFGWRVMLVEKAGTALFYVRDRCSGREGVIDNGDFLKPHQEKQMAFQPDMILHYARFLHDHYKAKGMCDPYVRAEVYVTLNGRPGQLFIDSTVDLSSLRDGFAHKPWILDAP